MIKPVMLNTGPLGRIAHPKPNPEIIAWLNQLLGANVTVMIPEIADKELDGDVILAAQALQVDAMVATENVGHLSRFVEATHWKDIVVTS